MLTGSLVTEVVQKVHADLLLHVDNQAVVRITDLFFSAGRPLMREMRKRKVVLDYLGLNLGTDWIPPVANKFADALSRSFTRGDLQIWRDLRHSARGGMRAPLDSFPSLPVEEHPVLLRRQAFAKLASQWSREDFRLLCLPVDRINATVRKFRLTKAPTVLLIMDWPRQTWNAAALHLATRSGRLLVPLKATWTAWRHLNLK